MIMIVCLSFIHLISWWRIAIREPSSSTDRIKMYSTIWMSRLHPHHAFLVCSLPTSLESWHNRLGHPSEVIPNLIFANKLLIYCARIWLHVFLADLVKVASFPFLLQFIQLPSLWNLFARMYGSWALYFSSWLSLLCDFYWWFHWIYMVVSSSTKIWCIILLLHLKKVKHVSATNSSLYKQMVVVLAINFLNSWFSMVYLIVFLAHIPRNKMGRREKAPAY